MNKKNLFLIIILFTNLYCSEQSYSSNSIDNYQTNEKSVLQNKNVIVKRLRNLTEIIKKINIKNSQSKLNKFKRIMFISILTKILDLVNDHQFIRAEHLLQQTAKYYKESKYLRYEFSEILNYLKKLNDELEQDLYLKLNGKLQNDIILLIITYLKPYQKLSHLKTGIIAFAIAPNGKELVTASAKWLNHIESENNFVTWDIPSGKQISNWQNQINRIKKITYNNQGTQIACGLWNLIIIYNAANGQELKRIPGSFSTIELISYSSDDTKIISCDHGNGIYIWDVASGQILNAYRYFKNNTLSCMVGVEEDLRRQIYDKFRASSNPIESLNHFTFFNNDIETSEHLVHSSEHSISPDKTKIICLFIDRILIYNLQNQQIQNIQTGTKKTITSENSCSIKTSISSLAFCPDNQRFVAIANNKFNIYDENTAEIPWEDDDENIKFDFIAFSPDGTKIATLLNKKTILILDAQNFEVQKKLDLNPEEDSHGLTFSKDGTKLIHADYDKITFIDLEDIPFA